MKSFIKILCITLCVLLLFGAVSCTNDQTNEHDPDDLSTANPDQPKNESIDDAKNNIDDNKTAHAVYDMTLFFGDWGSFFVHEFNAEGRLLRSNLKTDCDYTYGLTSMYMEHSYDESGVLTKTTVYNGDGDDIYSFGFKYKKYTEIKWNADESGRVISGELCNSADYPAIYKLSYHENGKLAEVSMRDMGNTEDEISFLARYDESGKKIYEMYDTDVEATFTYTDGRVTGMREQDLHDSEKYADWKIDYDEQGRIIKTERISSDGENLFYAYAYDGNSDRVVSFNHEGDDNGDKLRQQVTIKYTDDYYVSSVTQLYWESNDHGELDGPYEYRDEMEYNAEGKVTKVTISEHYDGNETRRDEISNVFVGNTVSSNEVQYRLTDGNLVKQSSQTETYTYDENGRTIGYTFTNFDSEGKRERILEKTYEYDERGNKLKEIEISSFGSTESQDTITTEYVYNDRNQQIKFTRVQTKGDLYIKSAHEYEYHDNTVRKKWTLTSYGADGTVSDVRIEEFDELGKDTFHEYIHYNNGQKIDYSQTTYTYGESGDIMIEECKTFNSSGILTGGILNRYEYTAEGKLSKTFITKYDKDENIILEEVRDHLAEQKPTP